jgi:pimeloyl-ACP methyl ester carboxylesterase
MSKKSEKLRRWGKGIVAVLVALVPLGFFYQSCADRIAMRRLTPPGRMVDVGGRRLHLSCSGDDNNASPTVILEASGLSSSLAWEKVQHDVAGFARVCAYDRAGMGFSDPAPDARTAYDMERDLSSLLKNAGLAPPYLLVGHSAGGFPVRLFASRHPEAVRGMVLVDVAPEKIVEIGPESYQRLRGRLGLARFAVRLGLLRLFNPLQIPSSPSFALTYRAQVFDAVARMINSYPTSAQQFAAARPTLPDLPLVVITHGVPGDWPAPGMIVPQEADKAERAWQSAQEALAHTSTRGKLVVARDCGHMIPQQRPDLVVQAIRDVLDEK